MQSISFSIEGTIQYDIVNYCYHCLDGVEPRLHKTNVCVYGILFVILLDTVYTADDYNNNIFA